MRRRKKAAGAVGLATRRDRSTATLPWIWPPLSTLPPAAAAVFGVRDSHGLFGTAPAPPREGGVRCDGPFDPSLGTACQITGRSRRARPIFFSFFLKKSGGLLRSFPFSPHTSDAFCGRCLIGLTRDQPIRTGSDRMMQRPSTNSEKRRHIDRPSVSRAL